MGFVFYDVETTGLGPEFNQIIQFAAIKTDYNFEEIDRFEIRSRLLPWIVPSSEAILLTKTNVAQLTDPTLPSHYEMVSFIQQKLNEWSPSIFIGHNSIHFDENFLRQAFYQTLHPLYLTNTNSNARSDSMRIIEAASLIAPDSLNIPIHNGKKSFKLAYLAAANGFVSTQAHSALFDVEATIYLCRLVSELAPGVWSNFVRFSQKSSVLDFIHYEDVFSFSDFYYGKPYSWIVTTIGQNPENKNENLVFDLAFDPDVFANLDDEALTQRLKDSPKPIRKLRANACPILFFEDDAPGIAEAKYLPSQELERRADRIKSDPIFSERLISAYFSDVLTRETSNYVEQQIYDKFIDPQDSRLAAQFHQIDWAERLQFLSSISDNRLRVLGERLIYAERPEVLPTALRHQHEATMARRVLGADGMAPWLTLPKAIQETNSLLDQASVDDAILLKELRDFLSTEFRNATTLLN